MSAFKYIYLARRGPTISAEDWPRAWRAHAKFASQFPVIGNHLEGVVYCARLYAPGTTQDCDGVAIASSAEPFLSIEMRPQDRARLDADELRTFGAYVPTFAFNCRETLILDRAPGDAAVIRFLARKADISRDTFLARWHGTCADTAKRVIETVGAVTRHAYNTLTEAPPPGYPFDGIVETWFRDSDAASASLTDDALAPLMREFAALCDMTTSVTLLAHVIYRWPRV